MSLLIDNQSLSAGRLEGYVGKEIKRREVRSEDEKGVDYQVPL
jgi:hypothetical protein